MRTLLAFLLVAAATAGCLGDARPDYDAIERDVHAAAMPFLDESFASQDPVDYDPARHAAGHNVQRVAYHNGVDETGDPDAIPATAYYTELAVTDQYAYVARASGDGRFGGFSILNLQEKDGVPDPVLVSSFDGLPAFDIEVDRRETLAFVGTQRTSIEQMAQKTESSQDPLAVLPRGTYVVDISDKRNPALANFVPLPYNGVHTLTYHEHVNGNEYVIACTYDLGGNTVPSQQAPGGAVPVEVVGATQRMIVYQLVREGEAPQLVQVAQYQIPEQGSGGRLFMPHDTSVQVHPASDRTLLYLSYWDKGLRILDFSQPTALQEIGSFTDFTPSSENAIHLSRPFPEPVADRHVTVTEPEIVSNPDETGYLTFLDTTDPAAPRKLGHWTLPGELGVRGLDFSPHNFDLWDGKVVIGHYHAGVWVIDASDQENLEDPKSVGFTMDVERRTDSPRPSPWFWGAFEHDGLIYATDEGTGLYVYEYTGP